MRWRWTGLVWVVDPLDGTTNFLHGHPSWCVSIGAAVDGELVAGTVFHVPGHRRYTAWQGGGAWAGEERLRVSTIRVPVPCPDRHRLSRSSTPTLIAPVPAPAGRASSPATTGVRRGGAAALDLVDVALGRFDAFWELMLAPWDMAAGIVLVREAGGVVTDLSTVGTSAWNTAGWWRGIRRWRSGCGTS